MPSDMHRDAARDGAPQPFNPAAAASSQPTAGGAFDTLVSAYIDELFADRPALATFQGRDGRSANSSSM